MVTSLATDTNDILRITKLLKKCPVYTTDKECDSQNLRNDKNFKCILNDAVKYNRDIIRIYPNINNIHFKPPLKHEIFVDIIIMGHILMLL